MKHFILYLVFFLCSFVASAADRFPVVEGLEPYVANGELAGIVTIIADKDRILQHDTIGFADIESQRPMKNDTVFWIASQTKPITAVAVMILVDEGKLSLTEPVTTYLPELNGLKVVAEKNDDRMVLVPVDKPITLKMLLSHTAGLEFLTPFHARHKIDSLPLPRVVTTAVMTPLKTQPMMECSYSNLGISLAGAVVERVSGMPFEEFVAKRIFEPLGMVDTTFFLTADQMDRLATGHAFDKEKGKLVPAQTGYLTYPLDDKNRFVEPGGGLFSTAPDLIKFFQMLLRDGELNGTRILSEAAAREIHARQTGALPGNQGLGMHTNDNIYGHAGAFGTETIVDRKTGRIFLYFIQSQGLEKAEEAKQKFYQIGIQP